MVSTVEKKKREIYTWGGRKVSNSNEMLKHDMFVIKHIRHPAITCFGACVYVLERVYTHMCVYMSCVCVRRYLDVDNIEHILRMRSDEGAVRCFNDL